MAINAIENGNVTMIANNVVSDKPLSFFCISRIGMFKGLLEFSDETALDL